MMQFSSLCLGLAALVPAAWSQGHSCVSPEDIAGFGSFVFDTTQAGGTNFGYGTSCNPYAFGTDHEHFFRWTATQEGQIRWEIDDPTGDLRLAVFAGGDCDAECAVRGERFEGAGSAVRAAYLPNVAVGDEFLVVIANTTGLGNSGSGAVGALRVRWDDCDPAAGPGDVWEENDTCGSAALLGPGTTVGLTVQPLDRDLYRVVIPGWQEASVVIHSDQGAFGRGVDAACTAEPVPFLQKSWYNSGAQPRELLLEVAAAVPGACASYDLEFELTPGPCYTDPGPASAFEPNQEFEQAAWLPAGFYPGLRSQKIQDPDYYEVRVPPFHSTRVELFSDAPVRLQWVTGVYQGPESGVVSNGTDSTLILRNDSGQMLPIRFLVDFPWNQPSVQCAVYDLWVQEAYVPCLEEGLGVIGDAGKEAIVANGTFSGLTIYQESRMSFVVAPLATLQLDLQLERPFGELRAELRCENADLCDQDPVLILDHGIGAQLGLQWTSTYPEPREVVLDLELVHTPVPCNRFTMTVGGIGEGEWRPLLHTFCEQATPHSGGEAVLLLPTWSRHWGVHLDAIQGPPGGFGFLLVSTAIGPPTPFESGLLCLDLGGASLSGRYNSMQHPGYYVAEFDGAGRWGRSERPPFGLAHWGLALPPMTPWGSYWFEEDSLHYQLWYRDPTGGSNLSTGLSYYP